jgi:hypothetical protein
MEILVGFEPVKRDLPGHEGMYVKIVRLPGRKLRRYRALEPAEAVDYLIDNAVVDFYLPGLQAPIRMAPERTAEALKLNAEFLGNLDEELEAWVITQCWDVNGEGWRTHLAGAVRERMQALGKTQEELGEEGVAALVREAARDLQATERPLGNSSASPEPTGEANPET